MQPFNPGRPSDNQREMFNPRKNPGREYDFHRPSDAPTRFEEDEGVKFKAKKNQAPGASPEQASAAPPEKDNRPPPMTRREQRAHQQIEMLNHDFQKGEGIFRNFGSLEFREGANIIAAERLYREVLAQAKKDGGIGENPPVPSLLKRFGTEAWRFLFGDNKFSWF